MRTIRKTEIGQVIKQKKEDGRKHVTTTKYIVTDVYPAFVIVRDVKSWHKETFCLGDLVQMGVEPAEPVPGFLERTKDGDRYEHANRKLIF